MVLKSISYFFSFVPEPLKIEREDGISALVVSRNEPFIEPSIESILNLVDEVILVDGSSGKWRDNVKKVCEKSPKIRCIFTAPDYMEQMSLGFSLTSRRWILKWDADFIAFSRIKHLKKLINEIDSSKYYVIYFSVNNIELDFFHMDPNSKFHLGHRMFQYSPRLFRPTTPLWKYYNKVLLKMKGSLPARTGYGPIPFWYHKIILNSPYAMHLKSVKPLSKLVERRFQHFWTLLPHDEKNKYGTLDKFVDYNLKRVGVTFEDFGKIQINRIRRKAVPYTGQHPELLKQWVEENFGVNFKLSKEFEMKLQEYLSE